MELSNETINLLLVGVAIVIGLYLLFKVASSFLKFAGIILLAGLVYYFWQGGTIDSLKDDSVGLIFKKSSLSEMEATNCPPAKQDKLKCDCVVPTVYQNLSTRLSDSEQQAVENDWRKLKEEIVVSLQAEKQPIRQCLVKEGGGDILKVLDKIWDLTKDATQKE